MTELKAHAKINLLLKIKGVTGDGYHDLFMLMQEISLADDIRIETGPSDTFEVSVPGGWAEDGSIIPSPIPEKEDLCYKAAMAFYEAFGPFEKNFSMKIYINKNIPSQAGLGGGSSDAAAILRFMREMTGMPSDLSDMIPVAAKVGADVPFFLYGGTRICEGIGEIMTSVPSLSGLNLVIAKPLSGVPTGKCFAAADSSPVTYDDSFKESVLDALGDVDSPRETLERLISEGLLVNDLEAPAREMVPGIGELISALRSENAVFAAMSGSGSAVFGIFDTEEDAHRAYDSLSECERYKDHFFTVCTTV